MSAQEEPVSAVKVSQQLSTVSTSPCGGCQLSKHTNCLWACRLRCQKERGPVAAPMVLYHLDKFHAQLRHLQYHNAQYILRDYFRRPD